MELGGRWHLVEPSVLSEVLELLLLTAQERGWPLDSVPAGSAAALLQEESTYDPRYNSFASAFLTSILQSQTQVQADMKHKDVAQPRCSLTQGLGISALCCCD